MSNVLIDNDCKDDHKDAFFLFVLNGVVRLSSTRLINSWDFTASLCAAVSCFQLIFW